MTGAEFVAGAKALEAAGEASKRVLGEDEAVKAQLLELSKDSAPMKDAAQSYARRIQIKQAVLTKIYEPLAKLLGIQKEYFDNQFADDLAQKMVNIPDENVAAPPPSVALPAMQGLGWSLDEPDLKEMYLNLLATASDERAPGVAHPSFADIIKQLSGDEARHLILCLRAPSKVHPIVQLRSLLPNGGGSFNVVVNNLIPSLDGRVRNRLVDQTEGVWLDNWVRLGLVTISFTEHLVAEGAYSWVDARPETVALQTHLDKQAAHDQALAALVPEGDEAPAPTASVLNIETGMMRITEFGKRFFEAVAVEETAIVSPEASQSEDPPSEDRPGPGA